MNNATDRVMVRHPPLAKAISKVMAREPTGMQAHLQDREPSVLMDVA